MCVVTWEHAYIAPYHDLTSYSQRLHKNTAPRMALISILRAKLSDWYNLTFLDQLQMSFPTVLVPPYGQDPGLRRLPVFQLHFQRENLVFEIHPIGL